MNISSSLKSNWPKIAVVAAFLYAIVLIAQYPIASTFPIGGDASRYIQRLIDVYSSITNGNYQQAATLLSTNTWYAGAQSIFALFSFLPLSWPDRFIWWVTIGHLAVATSLGLLCYRIAGWRSAATAIALWSLVTVGITPHTESGTAAQLWSLASTILFLHAVFRQSKVGSLLYLAATFFIHPISAIVLCLTTVLAWPAILILYSRLPDEEKPFFYFWNFLGAAITIAGVLGIWRYYGAISVFNDDFYSTSFIDLLRSPLGPFVILVPLGFYELYYRSKNKLISGSIVAIFCFLSILLAFNDFIGVHFMVDRWQSYGIISAIILASLAFPPLLAAAFNERRIRTIFVAVLFLSLGLVTWEANARIFSYYESPGRYARLHPDELAAIEWMRDNLPAESRIVSTQANRHSDWIPIISRLKWQGLKENEAFWQTANEDNLFTHAAFFLHREKPEQVFPASVNLPIVFQNDGVIIIQLP